MNENFTGVGERIQRMLDKFNMKQVEAAKKMAMSKTSLNNYISGNRIPDNAALLKFSKLFSVTIEWLLTGIDVPIENLIIYKEARNIEEFIQRVGRISKQEVKPPPGSNDLSEDKNDEHFNIVNESNLLNENKSIYDYQLKIKESNELINDYKDLSVEELRLMQLYKMLNERDKIKIEGIIEEKVREQDSLKKKERSSILTHGEQAAVKMEA